MRKFSSRSLALLALTGALFAAVPAANAQGVNAGGGSAGGGSTSSSAPCVVTTTYYGVTFTTITNKNGCNSNGNSTVDNTVTVQPAP